MKQFILTMFVLLLTGSYTHPCYAQTSDQYGELPDEERIQENYERLQQPLFRFGDMVYLQDDMGEYWIMDTTKVIVRVNGNIIPEIGGAGIPEISLIRLFPVLGFSLVPIWRDDLSPDLYRVQIKGIILPNRCKPDIVHAVLPVFSGSPALFSLPGDAVPHI